LLDADVLPAAELRDEEPEVVATLVGTEVVVTSPAGTEVVGALDETEAVVMLSGRDDEVVPPPEETEEVEVYSGTVADELETPDEVVLSGGAEDVVV
jgi:hypothetical protein